MSAAYRPYKDEDSLDNVQNLEEEILNWSDHEPCSIQIYEKTTEELPFSSNRKYLLICLGVGLISSFFGYLLGCFSHSHPNQCIPSHSNHPSTLNICDKLINSIQSESIEKFVQEFSSQPRIPGSQIDFDLSQKIKNYFTQHLLDKIKIEKAHVLLSLPDDKEQNSVSIIDSTHKTTIYSSITDPLEDHTQPFSYCAYSPAADVTGNLVFVNYGRPEDYQYLIDKLKINISGKILIAKQWDLNAKEQLVTAQQYNASALLLYPDHSLYNNFSGIKFPVNAVKRESVLGVDIEDFSSDSFYSFPNQENSLPTIPIQPISQNVALNLLRLLAGPTVPEHWKEGIDIDHLSVGPGFKNLSYHLNLKVNNKLVNRTIYIVIGMIEGAIEPDRYVLIGNHRDSWVKGAVDAASGIGAMLELSRVFGVLKKQGWRPRRSIIFCSWGAEEFNLLGLFKWVEENFHSLRARAVAYINANSIVLGNNSLSVSASPLLFDAIFNATRLVSNPETSDSFRKTVYDKWLYSFPKKRNKSLIKSGFVVNKTIQDDHFFDESEIFNCQLSEADKKSITNSMLLRSYCESAFSNDRPLIRPLEDTNVYAPFFFHLGIPVADMSYVFSNETTWFPYTLMHTQYDSFEIIKTYLDPEFKYHKALTQVIAQLVQNLADSQFIPFNLLNYVQEWRNAFINFHFQIGQLLSTNGINTDLLSSVIHNFSTTAYRFHLCQEKLDKKNQLLVRMFNDQLLLTERTFLFSNDLSKYSRKHLLHTSNEFIHSNFEFYEMYSTKELPQETRDAIQTELSLFIHSIQNAINIFGDILCDT